jgi:hypothetical protein
MLVLFLLASCGGGGGGGGADTTPPTNLFTTPYAVTVTAQSASNYLTWGSVVDAVSYNVYWSTTPGVTKTTGTKISVPDPRYLHSWLLNGTTYYYVVTAVDAAGTETAESAQVSAMPFAPPSGWSNVQIGWSRSFSTSIYPQSVKVNEAGFAVGAWFEITTGGFYGEVFANAYRGGVWNDPVQIGTWGANSAYVDVAASGDAVIVYVQRTIDPVTNFSVAMAVNSQRYDYATNTWSAAERISNSTTGASSVADPTVAIDANGNMLAVWIEDYQTWARRFDAATGTWDATATQLSVWQMPYVSMQRVVVDSNGIFTAVWAEQSAASGTIKNNHTLYARRFNASTNAWDATSVRIGYDPAALLGDADGGLHPDVAVNTAGDVFVVWEQRSTQADNSTLYSVGSAHYDPIGNVWSAPVAIESSSFGAYKPRVGVHGGGNAATVWTHVNADSTDSVYAAQYATGAWGTPAQVGQVGGDNVVEQFVRFDTAGNIKVLWYDSLGMQERRFDVLSGTWGTTSSLFGGSNFECAMSESGYVVRLDSGSTFGWTPSAYAVGWVYTP